MDYKKQYEILLKRFRHLLESDFIRSFDEWDMKKGNYKRDIKQVDKMMKKNNVYCDAKPDTYARGWDEVVNHVIQIINVNPTTADVKEVIHGQWKDVCTDDQYFSECTICGEYSEWEELPKFCPNCGADMRGVSR